MAQYLTDFYKNFYAGKKRIKKWPKFLFFIIILVAIICLVVTLFYFKVPSEDYSAKTFYFVYAGEYSSASKATETSDKVSSLGGAGVTYSIGNTMFVVVSAYQNLQDAETVKDQISGTFNEAGVLKVESKKLAKVKRKSVHDLPACKNYYKGLYTFCQDLQSLGSSYDIGQTDISKVYKNVMQYKQNFLSLAEGLKNSNDEYSKTMYASSLVEAEHIKSFFSSAFTSSNPSKYIKKLQIATIIEYISLSNLI